MPFEICLQAGRASFTNLPKVKCPSIHLDISQSAIMHSHPMLVKGILKFPKVNHMTYFHTDTDQTVYAAYYIVYMLYSVVFSVYRVFQDWYERFPTGIATTEITLELGHIHCCFKTTPRKPRNILCVLAAGPRLDLQGSCSRHY